MSVLYSRQAFNPSCPSGGSWYACDSGSNFVGCCRSDPCKLGCPDGNLEPASFDKQFYGTFPDQSCPSGSLWYTCTGTKPPFMGCCKTNPCANGGCPKVALTAGFLSTNPALAAPFQPSGANDDEPATIAPPKPAEPEKSNTAVIAGGAAGGGVAGLLLLALLLFFWRRRSKKIKDAPGDSKTQVAYAPANTAMSPPLSTPDPNKYGTYTDIHGTPAPSYHSPQMPSPYASTFDSPDNDLVSQTASQHSRNISHELPAATGLGLTPITESAHPFRERQDWPNGFPENDMHHRVELESNPPSSPRWL